MNERIEILESFQETWNFLKFNTKAENGVAGMPDQASASNKQTTSSGFILRLLEQCLFQEQRSFPCTYLSDNSQFGLLLNSRSSLTTDILVGMPTPPPLLHNARLFFTFTYSHAKDRGRDADTGRIARQTFRKCSQRYTPLQNSRPCPAPTERLLSRCDIL